MKYINKISITLFSVVALWGCASLDTAPEGYTVSSGQKEDVLAKDPSKAKADLVGMYASAGVIYNVYPVNTRADDFSYPAFCLNGDCNGPDMSSPDTGYNWFSAPLSYEDRTTTYASCIIPWQATFKQIKAANDLLSGFDLNNLTPAAKVYVGQAMAVRAFCYFNLIQRYQFTYVGNEDKLGVPVITEQTPVGLSYKRATVREVYEQIMDDLNAAVDHLADYSRGSKVEVDKSVALGLRARVNLVMQNWDAAASDAKAAMQGYTPLSIAQAGKPGFVSAAAPNVMWAIVVSPAQVLTIESDTWVSQYSSFTSSGYTIVGCYRSINNALYAKIPSTDVRKGWWVDENLESPLLEDLTWSEPGYSVSGQDIATLLTAQKVAFRPYTNVKFGVYNDAIGTSISAGDWPIMRVEEMYLIQAEAEAMGSAGLGTGKTTLESFVKTYRDPSYASSAASAKEFREKSVWFQRRVELWGEGFSMPDIMRLKKPVVRVIDAKTTNFDPNFRFNLEPTDEWLLTRFPRSEINSNPGIVQNSGGVLPVPGNGAALRDGITGN